MLFTNYIEKKAKEFYQANFDQFARDVYNYNKSFEDYMSDDNYFNRYINSEVGYDFMELKDVLNLSTEEAKSLGYEGVAKMVIEDLYTNVKVAFAQGLVDEVNEIDMTIKYEECTKKEVDRLLQRREKLSSELKDMIDI